MIAETKVTGHNHEDRPVVAMRADDGGLIDLWVDSGDAALTRRLVGQLTGVLPEEGKQAHLVLTGGARRMAELARRAREEIEELES